MQHLRSWLRGMMLLALCGTLWGTAAGVSAQSEDLSEALRLSRQANQLYRAGRYDEAVPLAERVLALTKKELGEEHSLVAQWFNILASLHQQKGDYMRAEALYQRLLAIRVKAFGEKHPDVATSLSGLARLYREKGDYANAEPLERRALAIREELLGAEHPDVAMSLSSLVALYHDKGEYDHAESLCQRALATFEKALGAEHPVIATLLNNWAALYDKKGDYVRAEELHQRALAVYEKAFGPEHPVVANTLNGLAELYRARGDYVRAEPLYQRSLASREKAFGTEHPDVAASLNNLALLYEAKGDYGRAEPLYQRALAIYEKALGAEHPYVAKSLNNLAGVYYTKGDYRLAEPLHQRALAIREKVLGTEHPDVANTLNGLASLYRAKGDYVRAEGLYQRALAIKEKALGAQHPDVVTLLNNLAVLYEAIGDYERALTGLTRAADIREQNIALILNTGSEQQKQLYLDTLSGETDGIVSLNVKDAPKNVAAARLALTTILRRKGRALDAMTDQITALRRRAAPEDQKLLDQLTQTRSQLADLQLGGASSTLAPAARQAQIANLTGEVGKLEAAISRRSAEFRAQAQPTALRDVQAALPTDAALIEIFSYQPFNAKAKPDEKNFGAAQYVAYVTRREGEPQFVDLGEAAAIEANIEKLRVALRDDKRAAGGDVAAVKAAARVVDEQVMRPVRGLLGATRRIFLSPDGALNLIPFAALVNEQGKYLVEDYTLTYLTSGRDLLRLQVTGESKGSPLVMANPLYDARGSNAAEMLAVAARSDVDFSAIDFSKLRYPPLPGTAEEAKALSALMPDARVLTAAEATEAVLKQTRSPRILHVATHGFFLTDQPRTAEIKTRKLTLTLGAAQNDIAAASAGTSRGENLLLRSGLILAGVNQRRSGANDDGVLTAAEAAALDLWGTKLVVLSACETGLGDVKNGAGVYGLRRALVLAGSESQVMSLWQVSDEATRDLMMAYYERLQRGEGRTEALRQVQFEMLNQKAAQAQGGERRDIAGSLGIKARTGNYTHPYYWASFIQSGAWSGIENRMAGTGH